MTDPELETLKAANEPRIAKAISGQLGVIPVPPNKFDMERLFSYLEDIGQGLGIVDVMRINAEERVSELLDRIDADARKMRLLNPGLQNGAHQIPIPPTHGG